MLRIAIPNKGALSGPATTLLAEAGYRQRTDLKDLSVLDHANQVEFFFLRPKDVAIYVGSGDVDLGITGRDMALESRADVSELLSLGISRATFRYAAPAGRDWKVEDLAGKRIATSYPNLVLANLAARGIAAEVVKLDGAVEIAIQLGVADAIADVVDSGRTLRQHGLVPFGDSVCDSEGVLVQRAGSAADERARKQFAARLQGVVFGQQYLMLDYDCPRALLDEAVTITPGIESPTISPLADDNWVAVRSMVPRKEHNALMDELAGLGVRAIIATDIRSCRAM